MEHALPGQDEIFTTEMTVGEILRRTRQHYGRSIQDIETDLRIRASQIAAIEDGRIEELPGRVYAIGFVRSYSEYLGLDGEKMVALFKTQSGGKAHAPALDFPSAASESKAPTAWVIAGSIVLFVIISAFWLSFQNAGRESLNEVPSVPAEMKAAQEPEMAPESELQAPLTGTAEPAGGVEAVAQPATAPDTARSQITDPGPVAQAEDVAPEAEPSLEADTAEIAAADASGGIILKIVESSWVEIQDSSGRKIVSRVLNAGEEYYVPDRPDLRMSLGNAGGVEIEIDGAALSPLGAKGDVKRNISLDAGNLKAQYAPRANGQ